MCMLLGGDSNFYSSYLHPGLPASSPYKTCFDLKQDPSLLIEYQQNTLGALHSPPRYCSLNYIKESPLDKKNMYVKVSICILSSKY